MRGGVVYRSAALVPGDDGVRAALAGLGLRRVYDLRTEAERAQRPDEVPAGAELVVLDVFGDSDSLAPAQLASVLSDPAEAAKIFSDGQAVALLADAYRRLVNLPSAQKAYRRLFTDLADPTKDPALFHCTAGKDRTGWASAALLLLLGVSDEAVTADFVAGNAVTRRLFQSHLDAVADVGGDPNVLAPLFEVQPSYLAAARDEVATSYGTIPGYFSEALGLGAEAQDALRERLLETQQPVVV